MVVFNSVQQTHFKRFNVAERQLSETGRGAGRHIYFFTCSTTAPGCQAMSPSAWGQGCRMELNSLSSHQHTHTQSPISCVNNFPGYSGGKYIGFAMQAGTLMSEEVSAN